MRRVSMRSLYEGHSEIIRYLIVGVLTTIVSLGVYYGLVLTVLNPEIPIQLQLANILSWIAAVTFAFITNKLFVFRSREKNIIKEGSKFYASRITTLFLDMLIMFVMVTLLHMNDKLAKLFVQVVVTVLNYVLSKFLVFR